MKKSSAAIVLLFAVLGQLTCRAWDYEGHSLVNRLALRSLPADFPEFAKTPEATERIAFLAGEPDRWRDIQDLNHANAPDHYIDAEQLADYGIDQNHLTPFRHDFTAQLAVARAAHPEKFAPIDPDKNRDHTRQLVGYLPWAIMENYDKLKSAFSYLKAFQASGGTSTEIANAQQDAIYIMGVMGHYVGDAAQPLHITKHHHGWVGENPGQYSTRTSIHGEVDGYFKNLDADGIAALMARIHPAKLPAEELGVSPGDTFNLITTYLWAQEAQVEPLYKLDKEGKLFGAGEVGKEGKEFLSKQIVIGGQMLGDLWYSAWKSAPEDTYLEGALNRRTLARSGGKPKN